jgi:hypothetical protein
VSTLICRTAGCVNNGDRVEFDLAVTDPDTGDTVYVDAVVCGICRKPITDIDPPFVSGAPVQL